MNIPCRIMSGVLKERDEHAVEQPEEMLKRIFVEIAM
jgi:hypothetical protein